MAPPPVACHAVLPSAGAPGSAVLIPQRRSMPPIGSIHLGEAVMSCVCRPAHGHRKAWWSTVSVAMSRRNITSHPGGATKGRHHAPPVGIPSPVAARITERSVAQRLPRGEAPSRLRWGQSKLPAVRAPAHFTAPGSSKNGTKLNVCPNGQRLVDVVCGVVCGNRPQSPPGPGHNRCSRV